MRLHTSPPELSQWIETKLLYLTAACVLFTAAWAEDKNPEADQKPEPPRIAVVLPLGVATGSPQKLTLRGQNLTNATAVTLTGLAEAPEVAFREPGEATKIQGFTPKEVGDQKLELELTLPADVTAGTNLALLVTTPAGESATFPLFVAADRQFTGEKEPNDGFRDAATQPPGRTIRGALEAVNDVDVFRFHLDAGRTLRAEVLAQRLGATLDASLTLYDDRGRILNVNDDGPGLGRDSLLEFKAPADGDYLLAISGVTERAGPASVYLLTVTVGE